MNRRNWLFSAIAALFGLGARRVAAGPEGMIYGTYAHDKNEAIVRPRDIISKAEYREQALIDGEVFFNETGEIIEPGDVVFSNEVRVNHANEMFIETDQEPFKVTQIPLR